MPYTETIYPLPFNELKTGTRILGGNIAHYYATVLEIKYNSVTVRYSGSNKEIKLDWHTFLRAGIEMDLVESQIVGPDDKIIRYVKNWGWLLRNWQIVESFSVVRHPAIKTKGLQPECVLIAYLNDGRKYVSGFYSKDSVINFLGRSIFEGRKVNFFGVQSTITKG
jgi:hypothetical protein